MAADNRYVYVAARPDGWHKVGRSVDLPLRMYHLGRDLGFVPVSLVYSFDCGVRDPKLEPFGRENQRDMQIENMAHWLLIDVPSHREWFNTDAKTAIAAVEEAARQFDAGVRQKAVFASEKRYAVSDQINTMLCRHLRVGESRQRFIQTAIENEVARRKAG